MMISTLSERKDRIERKARAELEKKLTCAAETIRVEAYAKEHHLNHYLWADESCITVDLGQFDRDPGPEREAVVQHLRELRRIVGTPLVHDGAEVSHSHENHKTDIYKGGSHRNVWVHTHVELRDGDPCYITYESDSVRYPTLVCGR